MGDARNEMTPTKDKTTDLRDKKPGMLGGLLPKRKGKVETLTEAKETFADLITAADKRLDTVIETKIKDLKTETGEEVYNKKALAILETARFHFDRVIDSLHDYEDLKH